MLGFYNVSVILTYIGLCSAVCGMGLAMNGHPGISVALLLFCGVCDMFDGTIARATKRSEDAKVFGIQIDSLCDMVCFGAYPAVFAFSVGVDGWFGYIAMCLYVLGAVIRLGYFNVIEQKRQQETEEEKSLFHGLPVTTAAYLLPIYYLFRRAIGELFVPGLAIFMFAMAVLFVLDIGIRNPRWKYARYVVAAVMILAALSIVIFAI